MSVTNHLSIYHLWAQHPIRTGSIYFFIVSIKLLSYVSGVSAAFTLTYSIYHIRYAICRNPLIRIIQFDMRELIFLCFNSNIGSFLNTFYIIYPSISPSNV